MQDLTHAAFLENLPSFIANGLPPDERARMSAHAALCAACDAALADALAADQHLRDLFAPVRPPADYEDALIANFRHATTRPARLAHPAWRFAGAAAAAVFLGFIGLTASRSLQPGKGIASIRFPSVASLLSNLGGSPRTDRALVRQLASPQTRAERRASDWFFDDAVVDRGGDQDADHLGLIKVPAAPAAVAPGQSTRHATNWSERDVAAKRGGRFDGSTVVTNGGTLDVKGVKLSLPSLATDDVRRKSEAAEPQLAQQGQEEAKAKGEMLGRQTRGLAERAPVTTNGPVNKDHLYSYFALTQAGKDAKASAPAANPNGQRVDEALYFKPTSGRDASGPAPADDVALRVITTNGETYGVSAGKQLEQTSNATVRFGTAADAQRGREVAKLAEDEKLLKERVDDFAKADVKLGTTVVGVAVADPATTTAPTPAPTVEAAPPTPAPTTTAAAQRKVIRNGTLDFEVDAFDSAAMQVSKIAAEEGGYVSSTDSEKLPNGKVKGTITLRVPPDRLDTLVLKLRGLGDLKSQKIAAQDVTKQYTDLEGQLKAARTMEQRLLDIIKTGKGEVKDLVEAEKQLGVYREKIEQVEGELRYYNNLVSLSTLNVSLVERDIRTPTAAFEVEEIQAGVETEDVERARAESLKSIEAAKGRVIESTMKNHGFGQYEARIVAEVAPDAAGPVLDRLKQLGRVARLDVDRKQQTTGGTGAPSPAVKLERRATRFVVSLYNLANVEPRETVNVSIAAVNVEEAYKSLLATATKEEADNNGRVVSRTLGGQRPDQANAGIVLETRTDHADAIEAAVRAAGEVMTFTTMENPDRQNTTSVKRKFSITIGPISQVEPRETQSIQARAKDVPAVYNKILAALNNPEAKRTIPVRIRTSQLNEQDLKSVSASLDFDFPRAEVQPLLTQVFNAKDAEVTARNVTRSADAQNTLDGKVRVSLSLYDATQAAPRDSTRMAVEVQDVTGALNQAVAAAPAGARVLERRETRQPDGVVTARLVLDVPADATGSAADALSHLGTVRERESNRNDAVPDGALARAQFDVRFATPAPVVGANQGVAVSLREGLSKAVEGLLFSLELLVVGLFLVVPFLLVAWILWKLLRRKTRAPKTITTTNPI